MSSILDEMELRPPPTVKWSSDNISTFLETYKKYDILWNTHHPDYLNKNKREILMVRLKEELIQLKVPVPDMGFLRARIKAIKTTYRGEIVKILESKASGAKKKDLYIPKLSWFLIANSFLRNTHIARKVTSDSATLASSAKDDGPDSNNSKIERIENQTVENEQNVTKFIKEDTSQNSHVSVCQARRTKKRGRPSKLSKVEEAIEKLRKITDSRPSTSNQVQLDEADIFGKYVAVQLRGLPLRNQLAFQDKIQSMLTKERLKLLESRTPSPPQVLSGTSSSGGDSDEEASIRNEFIAEGD